MPTNPHGNPVTKVPGKYATFGAWKNWIDSKAPGEGDVFIKWVEAHAKITPPESGKVDLNNNRFPVGAGFPNDTADYASNWFGTWILLGNVGPGIAKILAAGITDAGKAIKDQILPGFAAGVSPYQGGILGFLSTLTNGHTWLRVAEVTVGIVLLAVALNAFLKSSTGTSPVQVIGKAVPKVVPV